MNSEELATICHAAADYLARAWTPRHEAIDRTGKAVHPTHPEAVSWSMLGSAVAAAADAFPEDEESQEKAVNRIGRALSVVCSRRCGTERAPFWTSQHYEEQQGIFPGDAEQIVRSAAEVVAINPRYPGPPYHYGWWTSITGDENDES